MFLIYIGFVKDNFACERINSINVNIPKNCKFSPTDQAKN
jgi:hypothetical protein